MGTSYHELFQYDIYEAIRFKAYQKFNYKEATQEEDKYFHDNFPASTPNHPLLTDEKWLNENVELVFIYGKILYQKYQGPREYYMLFKTLISKYSIEDDYIELLYSNGEANFKFRHKWGSFSSNLIEFITYAFQERGIIDYLFNQEDFVNYFLNHPIIYDYEMLSDFGSVVISKLLCYPNYASYYIENPKELISLMRKYPKLEIPIDIFLDERLHKKMANNINVEEFYFHMAFIWENCGGMYFLEEHQKFCDKEVLGITNGILPSLINEYNNSKRFIYKNSEWSGSNLRVQVIKRIFERLKKDRISKYEFYRELSKYIVIGLLMSRCFLTSPYNLLIDIKTLYLFCTSHNREMNGKEFYEFLINFENYSIEEIVKFYNKVKDMPIKDIFYDDWQKQEYSLVSEINSSLFSIQDLSILNYIDDVPCYDITDLKYPLIVHNTDVSVSQSSYIEKMLEYIKNGHMNYICLSVQDISHQKFYKDDSVSSSVKLVYGKLDPKKVAIIYHTDAYSQGLTKVEWNNFDYIRRLYTLKELMMYTTTYNEIGYSICGEPFYPIGILCENEPTEEEIHIAKELSVPIFYRKRKELKNSSSTISKKLLTSQRYQWRVSEMKLFVK